MPGPSLARRMASKETSKFGHVICGQKFWGGAGQDGMAVGWDGSSRAAFARLSLYHFFSSLVAETEFESFKTPQSLNHLFSDCPGPGR
eukprot:755234-Hanusia_phi.AAC.5